MAKKKKTKKTLFSSKHILIIIVVLLISSVFVFRYIQNQAPAYVLEDKTSGNRSSSSSYLSAPTPAVIETTPTVTDGTYSSYTDGTHDVSITFPSSWKLTLTNYPNNNPDYLLFTVYEKDVSRSRIQLYNNFQGDFCAGSPNMTTSEITLNDGTVAKRYECSSSIAVNFNPNGSNLWLIATFVNDDNRETFHAMVESLLLSK